MSASNVVMLLGWLILIVSWLWPKTKWGGTTIKIALAALSTGAFLANAIYSIMS
jgi:hypothetical protein